MSWARQLGEGSCLASGDRVTRVGERTFSPINSNFRWRNLRSRLITATYSLTCDRKVSRNAIYVAIACFILKRGRKGGSCAQFTAIKDGKSRVTIITFRLSQFTENNIVSEEQRRLHIDYFHSRSLRKATNHCLCFFWKLFIYVMMGSFLVFFVYLIIGDVAKMSNRPMKNSGNVFRLSSFK